MNTGPLGIVFVAIVALIAGVTIVSDGQGANGNSPMDFVVGGGHHSVPDTRSRCPCTAVPLVRTPRASRSQPADRQRHRRHRGRRLPARRGAGGGVRHDRCRVRGEDAGHAADHRRRHQRRRPDHRHLRRRRGQRRQRGAPRVCALQGRRRLHAFIGFAPPLGPGTTTVKGGSTVPLKFQILDSRGNLITDTSVVADIEVARSASCSATSGDTWRFDATSHQFVFNSKTTGLAAGCYTVAVRTIDTLRHMAVTRAEPGTAGIPAIPGSPGGRQLPHGHRGSSWAVAPGSLTPPLTGC